MVTPPPTQLLQVVSVTTQCGCECHVIVGSLSGFYSRTVRPGNLLRQLAVIAMQVMMMVQASSAEYWGRRQSCIAIMPQTWHNTELLLKTSTATMYVAVGTTILLATLACCRLWQFAVLRCRSVASSMLSACLPFQQLPWLQPCPYKS